MALENHNKEDNHVEQIRHTVENIFPCTRKLEQIVQFNQKHILPNFLQLLDSVKAGQKELSQELENEKNMGLLINQNQEDKNRIETSQSELIELEQKEATLKARIEQLQHKLKKLESVQEKNKHSESKQKLNVCSNFAKVSKKFTGTNFEYRGPNISGYITGKDKIQVFDLNPSTLNKQNISKHLWDHLDVAANDNWLDIFDVK